MSILIENFTDILHGLSLVMMVVPGWMPPFGRMVMVF
jgi:hypothetical protein